jgi:hypothetical protein
LSEDRNEVKLTREQIAEVRAKAKKTVDAELAKLDEAQSKTAIEKALDRELLRQRKAAGLTDHGDDIIDYRIDCPPFTDRMVIDGVTYYHGEVYTLSRRKVDSMRETLAWGWDGEERAGNPNRKYYRQVAETMNPLLNQRKTPDGTLTLGHETSINSQTGAVTGDPSARGE